MWLYWLFSGYGLRASRAFVSLLVALIASACVFQALEPATFPSIVEALLGAIRMVVPGLRVSYKLSTGGQVTEIALSILGPILLGLGFLALRGRVRR